jgi:ferrous iron transport protein A
MRTILSRHLEPAMESSSLTLSKLAPGEEADVAAIRAGESLHQRLRAMGFRIGRSVRLMRRAAFRGPLHVRIGTTDLIIRQRDAGLIELRRP